MPLEKIKENIRNLIYSKKHFDLKYIYKNIFIILNSSLNSIRSWYEKILPLNEDISKYFIWSDENDIEEKLQNAFDIRVREELIKKGYSLMDFVQLIFIGDLTENETIEKIIRINEKIEKKYGNFTKFKIGAFLIEKENEKIKNFDKFKEITHKIFDDVFLIDIFNKNAFIKNENDLYSLFGHLLYLLSTLPISYNLKKQLDLYKENLGRNKDTVNSFSSFSYVLPIDEIFENIVIIKGIELIRESFLNPNPDIKNVAENYGNDFLNKFSLNNLNSLDNSISNLTNSKLKNPLSSIPQWRFQNTEDFLLQIENLVNSLNKYSEENKKIIEDKCKKFLDTLKNSLNETLNNIILKNKGGICIAWKFLKFLNTHVKGNLISERIERYSYNHINSLISEIRREFERSPKVEAFIARMGILWFSILLGIFYIETNIFNCILYAIPFTILFIFFGFLIMHSFITKIERMVIRLNHSITDTWTSFSNFVRRNAINEMLKEFQKVINDILINIINTTKRVRELSKRFMKEYIPPSPNSSSFWNYIDINEERKKQFLNKLEVNIDEIANDFLNNLKIENLWEKFSPLNTRLSEFESELLEKASLNFIPYCEEILNCSIYDILSNNDEFNIFLNHLENNREPFIKIKPEHTSTLFDQYILEIREEKIERDKLEKLTKIFQQIELIDNPSLYRISFFVITRGIKFEDIETGG
jgi:hypothetical protein